MVLKLNHGLISHSLVLLRGTLIMQIVLLYVRNFENVLQNARQQVCIFLLKVISQAVGGYEEKRGKTLYGEI